jgi:hypothetical protein
MSKKFDPAPPDKYAENPKRAERADRAADDRLDRGLEETFPASDPPSSAGPKQR